jgi:hypothetical protein
MYEAYILQIMVRKKAHTYFLELAPEILNRTLFFFVHPSEFIFLQPVDLPVQFLLVFWAYNQIE